MTERQQTEDREPRRVLYCDDDVWMREEVARELPRRAGIDGLEVDTTDAVEEGPRRLSEYAALILDISTVAPSLGADRGSIAPYMGYLRRSFDGPIIIYSWSRDWAAHVADRGLHEVHKTDGDLPGLAMMLRNVLLALPGRRIRNVEERAERAGNFAAAVTGELLALHGHAVELFKAGKVNSGLEVRDEFVRRAIKRSEQVVEVVDTGEWPEFDDVVYAPATLEAWTAEARARARNVTERDEDAPGNWRTTEPVRVPDYLPHAPIEELPAWPL